MINPGKKFAIFSLFMLFIGIIAGLMAAVSYLSPEFLKEKIGFSVLRPVHVSSVFFWITLCATSGIYSVLYNNNISKLSVKLSNIQFLLISISSIGILVSYFLKQFGGREYWEFNPYWSIPILISWLLFLVSYLSTALKIKNWPVYYWMWFTGIVFFIFIFLENYLWLFPSIRESFIKDLTIQWKVNGSVVGAYNQMIYATAFYLMDKITDNKEHQIGHKKIVFGMYFLGLTNLMFNWSHHIYTLPTDMYVKYIGYFVSMSEWLLFIRTIYLWKGTINEFKIKAHYFPYRFIIASEFWVFINLFQALLMSIPMLNAYTHGTHVTVAHAMGTTIGINTMILLSALFMFFDKKNPNDPKSHRRFLKNNFWVLQVSLFLFFISFDISGIIKGLWQMDTQPLPFSVMMESLHPWFVLMFISGCLLFISLGIYCFYLLKVLLKRNINYI